MKTHFLLFLLTPSLLLAQGNLDAKIRLKDVFGRGLSQRNYRNQDSTALSRVSFVRSPNLFNQNDPTNQGAKQISSDGLSLFVANNLVTSHYIPVKPNTTYYPSGKNRVTFWTGQGSGFISIIDGTRTLNSFATPSTAAFMRLSIDISTVPLSSYMVTEGSTAPSTYIPFQSPKLTLLSDKQLFNINDANNSYASFLASDGSFGALAGWNVTHYIPVTAGVTYYPSIKHNAAFYDANKAFLTPAASSTALSSARTVQAVTAPTGAAYVRFRVDVATWPFFYVVQGSAPTQWEPYVTPIDVPTTATKKTLRLITIYGQSNAQGAVDWSQNWRTPMVWNTYPPSYTGVTDGNALVSSSIAVGNNRTFSATLPSFVPLTGLSYNLAGEGPTRGFMDHIATKYPNEDMVILGHSNGGKPIAYLDKPTASEITSGTAAGGLTIPNTSGEYLMQVASKPITRILDYDLSQFVSTYYQGMWLIAKSVQLAAAENKVLELSAVLWLQGEADSDAGTSTYAASLQALYDDYNRDVLLLTGQAKKINWFYEQTNYSNQSEISGQAGYDNWVSHSYADAWAPGGGSNLYTVEGSRINSHFAINVQQVTAARDGVKSLPARNMYLAAPRYPYTSRIHMEPYVARRHGEFFAKAYARIVLEGQNPAPLFLPLSWWIEGNSVFIRFAVPKPPLRLVSPANAVTVTGKGHGFTHSAGAIQPSNVVILADDLLKITPDVAPAAGHTISYVVNVRSGDLCDSDLVPGLFTDRAGAAYTLTNYALPFTITLN